MRPDLDYWLPHPTLRVEHRRRCAAAPDVLWRAAQAAHLRDTQLLGRLIRWRIPGVSPSTTFRQLFSSPPFMTLEEDDACQYIVCGLVGRIWTLRRDYPRLADPDAYREFRAHGNARVLIANWVQPAGAGGSVLCSESRVEGFGLQGRLGLRAVRPIVARFGGLVGSDGLRVAVRAAEAGTQSRTATGR